MKSPEYWVTGIQIELYNCAERFMEQHKLNRKQLALHLGVSKGYVSQLLNGDYDHKLSKLVELSLAFGYVPNMKFMPIQEFMSVENGLTVSASQVVGTFEKSEASRKVYDYSDNVDAWCAGTERKEAA